MEICDNSSLWRSTFYISQETLPTAFILCNFRIHEDLKRTVDLCQKAEAAGVSWITVHGRSIEERHQPVHYDAIKIIKQSMSIPVVANGDIKTLKDAENVHHLTEADGKIKHTLFSNLPDSKVFILHVSRT